MGKNLIITIMIKSNKFLCPNWENIHAISANVHFHHITLDYPCKIRSGGSNFKIVICSCSLN